MEITKTKLAAASFGAALTSLYSAPELNAQTSIVFDSPTVDFEPLGSTYAQGQTVQFTNVPSTITTSGNAAIRVFNADFIGGAGIAFINNVGPNIGGSGDLGNGVLDGGVDGFLLLEDLSEPFGAASVFGGGDINFEAASTGIRYIGFTAEDQFGYFSVDLGTPGSDITFTGGQFFANTGQTVTVGGGGVVGGGGGAAIPEPSGVGLAALALGAVGLRRRRKATASTAA